MHVIVQLYIKEDSSEAIPTCNKTKPNSVALVRERAIPTEQLPLVGEVVPTFVDRGCCVVNATDYHGR
jgi:hypothetical protein